MKKVFIRFLKELPYIFSAIFMITAFFIIMCGCDSLKESSSDFEIKSGVKINEEIIEINKELQNLDKVKSIFSIDNKNSSVILNKEVVKDKDIWDIVLEYAGWIIFLVYILVQWIYWGYRYKTGKKSEMFEQILDALGKKIGYSKKIIYFFLSRWWVKKQEEKRKIK